MSDRLGAIGGAVEWTSAPGEGARDLGHDPAPVTDDEPMPDEDRAGSAAAPVVVIARSEVRTRWLGLVLIGLLAGVVGAVAISGIALARRTTTAYDRLGDATKVDDARGYVLRYPELVDELTALPVVTDRWVGGIGIAKVDGDNTFIGITAGPREPSPIVDPIVLDGRLPRASPDPDVIEIVLREDFQREIDVPLGSQYPVQFLSEADYFRFDTGFEDGEVHGPTAVLEVVGTVRLAGGFSTVPPSFAERGRPRVAPRRLHRHQLLRAPRRRPRRTTRSWRPPSRTSTATARCPPRPSEFSVVDVSDTSIAEASVDNTALLLGRALMILALSTAVVGGVAVTQALARHHTATARAREVEQALGMTRGQQTAARLLAGAPPRGARHRRRRDRRRGRRAHRADRRRRPLRAAPGRRPQRDGARRRPRRGVRGSPRRHRPDRGDRRVAARHRGAGAGELGGEPGEPASADRRRRCWACGSRWSPAEAPAPCRCARRSPARWWASPAWWPGSCSSPASTG